MPHPSWLYDESRQVGRDFSSAQEARIYDERMNRIADQAAEADGIIESLLLTPQDTLIDLGAGTGMLSLAAAGKCTKVHAVDVSAAMLDVAREKAQAAGLSNIEFHNVGFLTYQHQGPPADTIVSRQALHHLPNFWKQIALLRMRDMLKDAGHLCLIDAVLSFDPADHERFVEGSLARNRQAGFADVAEDIERNVREEYNTFDWVMEGMLRRAGFRVGFAEYKHGVWATYRCVKI